MNLSKTKPYQVIWLTIPIILLLTFIGMSKTLDIQMHDTYFVVAGVHIGFFFFVLLGLIGGLYWLFKERKLVNWMTNSHIVISITTALFLMLAVVLFQPLVTINFEQFRMFQKVVFVLLFLFVLSQFLFLINLMISLLKSKI